MYGETAFCWSCWCWCSTIQPYDDNFQSIIIVHQSLFSLKSEMWYIFQFKWTRIAIIAISMHTFNWNEWICVAYLLFIALVSHFNCICLSQSAHETKNMQRMEFIHKIEFQAHATPPGRTQKKTYTNCAKCVEMMIACNWFDDIGQNKTKTKTNVALTTTINRTSASVTSPNLSPNAHNDGKNWQLSKLLYHTHSIY